MGVEMGSFIPLVFGTNGGMGLDCHNFLRTLANKLSTKNNEPYASVISWLRIQLSFAILRTVHRWSEVPTSSPGLFPQKMGGAGKGPGIGWSRVQPKYS